MAPKRKPQVPPQESLFSLFPEWKRQKEDDDEEIHPEPHPKITIRHQNLIYEKCIPISKSDEISILSRGEKIFQNSFKNLEFRDDYGNTFLHDEKVSVDGEVSIFIKLYSEHFTIESTNESKEPIILRYNSLTKQFLRELTTCRLTPELWEEIQDFPCVYYDGGIICEVLDMNNSVNNRRLILRPDPEAILKDFTHFLESNHHDLSEEDKITVYQNILELSKPVCLDPDTEVLRAKNLINYNNTKVYFRRKRKFVKHNTLKKRSVEHPLISYVIGQNWNTSGNKMFLPTENIKEEPKIEFKLDPVQLTPLQFLGKTESILHNNRPQTRQKVLKFQSTSDKARIWKVEIIPYQGSSGVVKRYDSIITPPNESPSRWILGSKYATDMYVKRLKDMFTTYGKSKCIVEQEIDMQQLAQYRSGQQGIIGQGGQPVPIPQGNQPPQQPFSQVNVNPVVQPQPSQPVIVQSQRVVAPPLNPSQHSQANIHGQPSQTQPRPQIQQQPQQIQQQPQQPMPQRPLNVPVKVGPSPNTPTPTSPRQNGQYINPPVQTYPQRNPRVNPQRSGRPNPISTTGTGPLPQQIQQQPSQNTYNPQMMQGNVMKYPNTPMAPYTMNNTMNGPQMNIQLNGQVGQNLGVQQQITQQLNSQNTQSGVQNPLNISQLGPRVSPMPQPIQSPSFTTPITPNQYQQYQK